jgi:hypothetical protein
VQSFPVTTEITAPTHAGVYPSASLPVGASPSVVPHNALLTATQLFPSILVRNAVSTLAAAAAAQSTSGV